MAGTGKSKAGEKPQTASPDYALYARGVVEQHRQTSGDGGRSKAGLAVVATPLGHRGDITLRALVTLAEADRILCEDTRVTGGLLHHYGIKKPLLALHDHNESARLDEVLRLLQGGEALALVSDAGMPLIADPGFKLVRAVRAAGFGVSVIPGPSAFVTALAGSGLPTDCFTFCGFVPSKAKARAAFFLTSEAKKIEKTGSGGERVSRADRILSLHDSHDSDLSTLRPSTLIYYETAPRLAASLAAMAEIFGADREAVVARELTKLFEEYRAGTLGELAAHYAAEPAKGEIVILVAGAKEDVASTIGDQQLEDLLTKALTTQSLRDAVEAVSQATGVKKKVVYQLALRLGQ